MTLRHRLDGPEDADVLALSNSIGTFFELWDRQVPALTHSFRVLRYDHPPDADSVDLLAGGLLDLLDELGLDRVSLCGLSIGGAVGMWLAANAPDRIARLVLACTSTRFGPPEAFRGRAALVRSRGMEAVADSSMGRWFTPRFAGTLPYRQMLLSTPAEAYARACEALVEWDFEDRLPSIAAPTLVIAGAEDPSTPPEHARLIAAGIPAARLVVLEGAAHFANVEQPERFDEEVLAHLGREVWT